MSPHEIISARQCGEIRITVVTESTGDLARVLAKCGLNPDPTRLIEHSRKDAEAILRDLLWKDMAHEGDCMTFEKAEEIASKVLLAHAVDTSRYYSNGNWAKRESWNPMTESTFDAGLLVTSAGSQYFCIWFQDED